MSNNNIFEIATKNKFRFSTTKGSLSVEDLWALSLESLDNIGVGIKKQLRDEGEESLLPNRHKNKDTRILETKLDIIKHIIEVKLEEQKQAAERRENRAQLDRLRTIAANKADEALTSQSLEDINKLIRDMEARESSLAVSSF